MRGFGQKKPKISLALRAAAIQQHMEIRMGENFDPIVKPKTPKKSNKPATQKQHKCSCGHHHFNPIPTNSIFESETVSNKQNNYNKNLTLAEKLGIVEPPPAPLTDEQFETVKIEAEKRGFFNECCPICLEKFGPDNMVLLSCSHLLHATCLMNFRKFSRGQENRCPVCRQPYEFVRVKAESAYNERCAITIQRVFRGFLVRSKLGELAPEGTELHRKWILNKAHLASDMLVSAVDRQSDAIDAVLGSIDHDLEWARNVMKAAEEQGKLVDWETVKQTAMDHGGFGDCPVCLRQMRPGDSSVTSCGHIFHTNCLQSWVSFCEGEKKPLSCPCCRSPFQFKTWIENVTEAPKPADEEQKPLEPLKESKPKPKPKPKKQLPKRSGWR